MAIGFSLALRPVASALRQIPETGGNTRVRRITPVSRFRLIEIPLDLSFLQPIAMAIGFSPALRPVASALRQIPETGGNTRVSPLTVLT